MSPVDGHRHIAIFSSSLAGGGVERCIVNLARSFSERGHRVDLVLTNPRGPLLGDVPEGVRIVKLPAGPRSLGRWLAARSDPEALAVLARPVLLAAKPSPILRYLRGLVRYLEREEPDALLGAMSINYSNLAALWARSLARVSTRVVLTQPTILSRYAKDRRWRKRYLPDLARHFYPLADDIVAVSQDVADDVSQVTGVSPERIHCIPNPVITSELLAAAESAPRHPFLAPGSPPFVMAAGRLHREKDFPTLLRAFARVREGRPLRLILLGDGPEKARLEALARELDLGNDVSFPGFQANPYGFMRRAAAFVSSSLSEGFGNAIVEALACGCAVVSTRCPGGPVEILEGGRHGRLVPMGDWVALAEAMARTLDEPPSRETLRRRGLEFSVDQSADRYLDVILGTEA